MFCLTCDINIDRTLFLGPVTVAAVVWAGVQGLDVTDTQVAAVVLPCLSTTGVNHFHLILVQVCRERP